MAKVLYNSLYGNYINGEFMVDDVTTIQLTKRILNELKTNKQYSRQTYSELIHEMIKIFKKSKLNNQYDEFLHKVQQEKMKELWDNKEDEAWENA